MLMSGSARSSRRNSPTHCFLPYGAELIRQYRKCHRKRWRSFLSPGRSSVFYKDPSSSSCMSLTVARMKRDDSASNLPHNETARQGKGYVTEHHGVWDILFMNEDYRMQLRRLIDDLPKSLPSFYQLVYDIYSLSPVLFILFCASQLWSNCQGAINLHFSSELLRVIEFCLKEGVSDYWSVGRSISMRLITVAFAGCISWYNERLLSRMRRRIISHFELRLMKAKLSHDLAKSGSAAHQINVTSHQAWSAFDEILRFVGWIVDALSQFTLIIHLARRNGGPFFALLCIIKPIVSTISRQSLWDKICIVKQTNEQYIRMEALTALTGKQYRQDVISGDLQDYIMAEYKSASQSFGDTSDADPWSLYEQFRSPFPEMTMNILGDLPVLYCAFLALTNPKNVSFASIAILQESANSMSWSVEVLVKGLDRFRKSLKQIRELYDAQKPSSDPTGGDRPPVGTNDATEIPGGMGFEFRDVSFMYPGSQTNTQALSNINLTIKPGQFVVLVGTNGSGKSTLVKLLARLYQPPETAAGGDDDDNDVLVAEPGATTGEMFIDSQLATSYTESSLRRSMAILSQDNLIYPGFSLGENIGLGYTPLLSDADATLEAADKAGATEVLKRMKNGVDTVLDPMSTHYSFNVREQEKGHPLKEVLKELRRPVEVSGGERQRIVAARTFMRFKSGKIRLLAVDEPSSALDAEAESALLENLLKERAGKTIIFVTHRFGKLTRQADLIVCLKEGKIVESGTHKELMKIDGEYKKLYDIQASAFQDDGTGIDS
ncbi:P-loop containing nucleoside triphosphate hydrolase protein [Macrolepiota fuliginosa MF-IS2]|uniref:P-loop containing nucleoside triphosphate hydrolase protein n=1 Tax=Macrolepiota fuliginosa MF-IS2 TaxID=1400762 RepID=A0A9P6C184_9AGAR|nr:P-loop containing nucleoside triphosphate hydrolase protein [Macrolepiota fuliginosa MF-IS2]